MLTSSNQYLRPEYLTPLPTTLDAKKSPLALLAQTCSQIGSDSPNTKLLQSSEKKSSKADSSKEKAPGKIGENARKATLKGSDVSISTNSDEDSSLNSKGSEVRTPIPVRATNSGRCSSSQSMDSACTSPSTTEPRSSNGEGVAEEVTLTEKTHEGSPVLPSSTCRTAFTPNILTSSSDPTIKDLPLGTFKPGMPSTPSPFVGYPVPGFPLNVDLMTTNLMSQHHVLKTAALNPYFGYGRIKQQEHLQPICRDPYCAGCSVSGHLLGTTGATKPVSCSTGCTQCDHTKSTSSAFMGHSPSVVAYAHAQLAAIAAASNLPYICNWISGDAAYCGKRFSSSEELLSHLRTHTSGSAEPSAPLSILSSSGIPQNHPLVHRTYPTPPLSPLSTPRYHPYNKPSLLPPSLTSSISGFSLTHPSLNPYLSPYTLYGPRLGSTPSLPP